MKRISPLIISLCLAGSAWSQSPTTAPAPAIDGLPATRPVADTDLGKLFRSRIAGIEFNPPAGGAMIRDLNSGEIVRFMYADTGWDMRAKTFPLHTQYPLPAVLDLMSTQLLATSPAASILRQEIIKVNGQPVALIEAKFNLGPDRIFTQQAIFPDVNEPGLHYLLLQMTSRCDARPVANVADPLETSARQMFAKVLPTVKVLDRSALAQEQKKRYFSTKLLFVHLEKQKIIPAIQPLQLMRIVHDDKDIGFVQVNERLATHSGRDGVEVIVHSRVQSEARKVDADKPVATGVGPQAAGGIVLPGLVGPVSASGGNAVAPSAAPSNVFTNSTFFVTFDRAHEDWTSITQVDEQVASQLVESANADLTTHIDRAKAIAAQHQIPKPGEPSPDVTVPDYNLNIEYSHGRRQDKPANIKLLPDYLPQATAQMLPQLLADEPGQYMFSFYVSGEQKLMRRYIDVDQPLEVTLDGKTLRAVPISDRVGVDGIPTVHYVTREGEWLGSVNEEQKVTVLPTDEATLTNIWSKQPLGFKVADVPPPQVDAPVQPRKTVPAQHANGAGNLQGPAPMSR